MIIASIILGLSIIIAAAIMTYPKVDHTNAAMDCLKDLVDSINKELPGSTLTVTNTKGTVIVSGSIRKYVITNENN